MNKTTCLLLVCLLCIACDSKRISFSAPQPSGTTNLTEIPNHLIGNYLSEEDSLVLQVTSHEITTIGVIQQKGLLDSMLTESEKKNFFGKNAPKDTTIIDEEVKINLLIREDSAFISLTIENSMFLLAEGHLLRTLENHYFLNHQRSDKSGWMTTVLSQEGLDLLMTKLPALSNPDSLEVITKVETLLDDDGEATHYILSPTPPELLKLVEMNKSSATVYRRIN